MHGRRAGAGVWPNDLRLTIAPGGAPEPPPVREATWETHRDRDGHVAAYARRTADGGWLRLPDVAWFRFRTDDCDVEAYPEPGVSSGLVLDAFHRVALPMIIQARNDEVLHASAVRNAAGVHVFCGASCSGKSTIAHALGSRGLEVWADDAVPFTVSEDAITALPLAFALRLREDAAAHFGAAHAAPSVNGKVSIARTAQRESAPVASVWLLQRDRASRIERLGAGSALPAVLFHSFYFTLEEDSLRRRMAESFLELVARVPIYRLTVPSALEELANMVDAVEGVIRELGDGGTSA
jgi:hypothetical protein